MGSFARTVSKMAPAALAGVALVAASPAANAQAAVGVVIRVPCDSTRLPLAVAQAGAAGAAVIRLAPNCTYLTTSELLFAGRIVLLGGPSTAIKGDPASPPATVLHVGAGATLRAQGILITGGLGGGGIANEGNLTLNEVTLTGNSARFNGGGLNNFGHALVVRSLVRANTTILGGGLWNGTTGATMTVFESIITGNNAINGGGVFTDGEGSTRIVQSTITGNTADQGGGLYNNNDARTSLTRTLIAQNKADLAAVNNGGGIFDNATPAGVTLRLTAVRRNAPNNCTPAVLRCLG